MNISLDFFFLLQINIICFSELNYLTKQEEIPKTSMVEIDKVKSGSRIKSLKGSVLLWENRERF